MINISIWVIFVKKNLSLDEVIVDACKKLKGTYLNIANSGLHDNGLNPITSLHIYNFVLLPKALYGCELWCKLSPKHILHLERAHRFCLKFMQNLPRNTKSEVALNLLASKPIEVEIDQRKLIFFNSYAICLVIYVLRSCFYTE